MEDEMKNILERIEKGVNKSLEVDQLMIRDRARRWEHEDNFEKAKVIDEQITDILTKQDAPCVGNEQ